MTSKLPKIVLFAVALALFVFLFGGLGTTPISADSPQSGPPPTVALPTPIATKPAPRIMPSPLQVAPTAAPRAAGSLRGAYGTSWTTSITYQNIGTGATTSLHILFYPNYNTTSPVDITQPNLNSLAATSLYVGSVSGISSPFNGSAVMQSDQPLAATLVQLPQGTTTVKNRPLSDGFTSGGPTSLIASALSNTFNTNTNLSIQNADSVDNNMTAKFYDTNAVLKSTQTKSGVKPGATWMLNVADVFPSGFNGSVVISAKRADNTDGQVVSSAMELEITTNGAKAFEGVTGGATTVYMPSALCQYGSSLANTAYAVQNTSLTTSTNVTVAYSNGATQTQSVGPGAKKSFIACNASGVNAGFLGSAKITSSGGIPVVAIGKAYDATGMGTAFVGTSTGAQKVSVPYVRYASNAQWSAGTHQRTFITIQNIGTTSVNNVTVKYYNPDGTQAGSTHTIASIAPAAKANSNATNAGLTTFGYGSPIGGAAIVEGPAGAQLAVVARVSTQVGTNQFVSEDYNGVPVQ